MEEKTTTRRNKLEEKPCPNCGKMVPVRHSRDMVFCSRVCEVNYKYSQRFEPGIKGSPRKLKHEDTPAPQRK